MLTEFQEEKFELIATSLKNAKAVIIYFFSDQRNQTASSILINNIRLSSFYNSICVRDCSPSTALRINSSFFDSPFRRIKKDCNEKPDPQGNAQNNELKIAVRIRINLK